MTILETYNRIQLMELITMNGLPLTCCFERNMSALHLHPYFEDFEYGDKVLLAGIMYAMKKNNTERS